MGEGEEGGGVREGRREGRREEEGGRREGEERLMIRLT